MVVIYKAIDCYQFYLRSIFMKTRKVTITLTNRIVGSYEARSYPQDSQNNNKEIELYRVPLYEMILSGKDDLGKEKTFVHKAPRFMPYWNNPANPDPRYKTRGWANSGLSSARIIVVTRYIAEYKVHNRLTKGHGAIVLKGTFYIHAGPADENDAGYGSAGCVETIGNYDTFKSNIMILSGLKSVSPDDSIQTLVDERHLIVHIQGATVPDIRKNLTRKIIKTW